MFEIHNKNVKIGDLRNDKTTRLVKLLLFIFHLNVIYDTFFSEYSQNLFVHIISLKHCRDAFGRTTYNEKKGLQKRQVTSLNNGKLRILTILGINLSKLINQVNKLGLTLHFVTIYLLIFQNLSNFQSNFMTRFWDLLTLP